MKKEKFLIPLAIIAAGIIIAGAIVFSGSNKTGLKPQIAGTPPPNSGSQPQDGSSEPGIEPKVEGEPYLGNPQAKVKIVYYGDFQCPFCKRYEGSTLPVLKENYLDTGKAVLYFKNFQFLGPDSTTAGIAGECLIKQLAGNYRPYWQWHEAMFAKQDAENSGFGKADDIKQLVRDLNLEEAGINLSQFEQCLDNKETLAEVQADTQEGQADGVRGTPATIISGKLISGAQPTNVFIDAIEAEL